MFEIRVCSLVCVLTLLAAAPAWGVVTSDQATSETDPAGPMGINWDYVYPYKGSSAVAVSPYFLLTAHHVADDAPSWSTTISGTVYTELEVIYHSPADDPDPTHTTAADLALVRLDKALPGHYDIYSGAFSTSSPPRALELVMIGFGYAGTVAPDGESYDQDSGTARIKRWGTNTVSSETEITGLGYTYEGMIMDFSDGATTYEAGAVTHDSGGGVFVQDPADGVWKLAGTTTVVYGPSGARTATGAVEVGEYQQWITATVPEPASLAVLGFGGLAGLWRRRRAG